MLAQSATRLMLQPTFMGALKEASEVFRCAQGKRFLSAAQAQPEPRKDEQTTSGSFVSMWPGEAAAEAHVFKLGKVAVAAHPGMQRDFDSSYLLHQPAYTKEYVESVSPIHKPPEKLHEKLGLFAIKTVRSTFDLATGWNNDITEAKALQRIIFLETVAGVPGMVAAMLRHLRSLRTMKRDYGWIHTLLEEAENERMHLLVYMQLRQPGPLFRAMVLMAQGVFFNLFFLSYIISPRTCHSFVGYLEEEAVKTYTKILQAIDEGKVWKDMPAPPLAKGYWRLGPNATMRDVVLATRADEQCHSHVNHSFANLPSDAPNPFNAEQRQ